MSGHRPFNPGLLRSLEVLVSVAETGQMKSGAQMLGLTQPAASQHIAALEKEFGTRLLDRSTRPARLTHAGLRLHQQALKALGALADIETAMRHTDRAAVSLLRVGLQASVATTLTPELVSLAQEQFGVRDITLHAGQSGDHERLLRTKQADLAISSDPFLDLEGLERHPILTEAFLLVLPQDYAGPTDSLDAVQERLPLVRFADSTYAGRLITQHLRRLSFEPRRVIQADRSSMVTSCVAQGMGYSLLTPTLLIDGLVENMPLRVVRLPVAGLSRTLTVVARKGELHDLPLQVARISTERLLQKVEEFVGPVGLSAVSRVASSGMCTALD
ncbi:MAG: LysR family transcriptional regulator [Pseudomonadota bacterium]